MAYSRSGQWTRRLQAGFEIKLLAATVATAAAEVIVLHFAARR